MIACTGRLGGFTEKPWNMEGRSGISRKMRLDDGGGSIEVKITAEVWDLMPADLKAILFDFENHPSYRVTCSVDQQLRASDAAWFVIEPYQAGVTLGQVAAGASKSKAA